MSRAQSHLLRRGRYSELGRLYLLTTVPHQRALMRRFKSRSSLVLHQAGVEHDPVWQSGYQDRALRREESMVHVARYIVANPLRAGLVRSVRDYPHWDAVWL
ncbi:transposase [Pseudomonas sp. NPDC086566]|uniref:transposase n=1 Tax=Pseudomonas sp. NPDC086566 TaxID=3390647 RepID=UPI003D00BA97